MDGRTYADVRTKISRDRLPNFLTHSAPLCGLRPQSSSAIMKDVTQADFLAKQTTVVQKLQDIEVPPNQIIQITGHKNLQSVNNYRSLREKQTENISHILSSTSKAAT